MNMRLFQEIFELNQAFERVIEGLKGIEKVRLFPPDAPYETRAEVVLDEGKRARRIVSKDLSNKPRPIRTRNLLRPGLVLAEARGEF
jgi:hypothetical protein